MSSHHSRPEIQASLSAELRAATADVHRATESVPALAILLSDVLDLPAYRSTQAQFYGVFEPLESSLRECRIWGEMGLDPPHSSRALEGDLRALGVDPGALPRADVPAACDPWEALGRAYVLEGSRLGARFIENRLGRQDWFDHRVHGRYFNDDPVGHRWRVFKSAIDSREVGDRSRVDALAAARNTFLLIHDWMMKEEHVRPGP